MDEMTLTLNSPITEEQWDMIEDVDFDRTDSITFYTKHGKEVEFVKRKTGKWIKGGEQPYFRKHFDIAVCSNCNKRGEHRWNFCPNCGARMNEGSEKG